MNSFIDGLTLDNPVLLQYGVQMDACRLVEVDNLVDYQERHNVKGYLTFVSYDPIIDNQGFATAIDNMVRDGFDNRIMATVPRCAGIQIRRKVLFTQHEKSIYGDEVQCLIVVQYRGQHNEQFSTWAITPDGVYAQDFNNPNYKDNQDAQKEN